MKNFIAPTAALGMLLVVVSAQDDLGSVWQKASVSGVSAVVAAAHVDAADVAPNDVIQGTCVRCHNERRLSGNLSLDGFDVNAAADNADIAERMIRKLRAGMMPPPGVNRPGGDTLRTVVEEGHGGQSAAAALRPGRPRPGSSTRSARRCPRRRGRPCSRGWRPGPRSRSSVGS